MLHEGNTLARLLIPSLVSFIWRHACVLRATNGCLCFFRQDFILWYKVFYREVVSAAAEIRQIESNLIELQDCHSYFSMERRLNVWNPIRPCGCTSGDMFIPVWIRFKMIEEVSWGWVSGHFWVGCLLKIYVHVFRLVQLWPKVHGFISILTDCLSYVV